MTATIIPISDPSLSLTSVVAAGDLFLMDQIDGTQLTGYKTKKIVASTIWNNINPTPGSTNPGFVVTHTSIAGSTGHNVEYALNSITVNGDTIAAQLGVNSLGIFHNFGGSTVTGTRSGLIIELIQTAPTSPSNLFPAYVAITPLSQTDGLGDGGTDTTTGAKGTYFGANPQARSSAQFVLQLCGQESNVFGTSSASSRYHMCHSSVGLYYNRASQVDAAYEMHFGGDDNYGPATLTATVTMTIASPCVVTDLAHGLGNGTAITLTTTGALPTGLTLGTVYYVKKIDANSYNLALTPGGTSINTTGTQSPTHTRKIDVGFGIGLVAAELFNGASPIAANGTFIGTFLGTLTSIPCATVIDISKFIPSGNQINGRKWTVDANGQPTFGDGTGIVQANIFGGNGSSLGPKLFFQITGPTLIGAIGNTGSLFGTNDNTFAIDGVNGLKVYTNNTIAITMDTSQVANFAQPISVGGTQVVKTRQTGWTVATGTPSRATFTTAGVTLPTLAGVVMALEQDLIAHGLIGT